MEESIEKKMPEEINKSKYIFFVRKGNYDKYNLNNIEQKLENNKKLYRFICPIKSCPKAFQFKNNLVTHIRTHFKIRPYICSYCFKAFNEKGNLKTHLRIHTGERPYQCLECKKNFKTLGQLKDHILSHTYYKPFQYIIKIITKKISKK